MLIIPFLNDDELHYKVHSLLLLVYLTTGVLTIFITDMPEEKLIAHAAVFVQGGFDTTASILSWCVYELAFHPEIQV